VKAVVAVSSSVPHTSQRHRVDRPIHDYPIAAGKHDLNLAGGRRRRGRRGRPGTDHGWDEGDRLVGQC
jgi:hypothetical protein